MSFDSFPEFLAMGGHGLYVWLCYGASLIVVLANVVSVRMARKRYFHQARSLERRLSAQDQTDGGTSMSSGNQTNKPA